MKKTRKQNILLVTLFLTLLSCGGGGGGGGGSTSAPAPTTPTTPTVTTPTTPATPTVESALDLNGHIKWNDTTFSTTVQIHIIKLRLSHRRVQV